MESVDLFAPRTASRSQPVENLVGGAIVVPDPLALVIGPGLAVVEGAADDTARFTTPALVGTIHAARPAAVPRPVLVGTFPHDAVIHRRSQVGDGDLAIAEVPDAAPVGGVEIHVLVARWCGEEARPCARPRCVSMDGSLLFSFQADPIQRFRFPDTRSGCRSCRRLRERSDPLPDPRTVAGAPLARAGPGACSVVLAPRFVRHKL